MNSLLRATPEKLITFSFLSAILLGMVLLKLPVSSVHEPLSWIDALFMATSAVCVTGLSVLDVGRDLTLFGQIVLLSLIQLGGLGIMTFSFLFFFMMGMRTSLTSRLSMISISDQIDVQNLRKTVLFIMMMTFLIELVGTGLLYIPLKSMHPPLYALYSAVFHSISAFCNAGFSLYSDSLERFRYSIFVPFIMMGLIVAGGLGFIVLHEINEAFQSLQKGRRPKFSLHTRMCVSGTVCFIMLGAVVILGLEYKNLLSGLSPAGQIINALFLSVTSRTAGFNTVPTNLLSNATLFFLIVFMFVGGCPGSTAGGIKMTTFLSLFSLIRGKLRGDRSASLFNRKIPQGVIDRSLGIFGISFILIGFAIFLFLIAEQWGVSHSLFPGSFLNLFFEVVSAFGTVGLTTGVTGELTVGGRTIIILLMFIGRIGPLTLGLAILIRKKQRLEYEYAEENVMVG